MSEFGKPVAAAGTVSFGIVVAPVVALCDTFSIARGNALSIRKVSIRQIKAARALLAWSQEQMAEQSSVSVPTVKRIEAADGPIGGRDDTAQKLIAALEEAGIEFIPENGSGAGVRLRKDIQN
ncbi:helix-turn-helix domain-containing protein [Methylocella silvestris]